MFEKEAEEYREKGKNEGYYLVSQEMEQEELDYIIDESYKDGFKDGYNKANEWHYPSKGEYPKENGLLMSKTLNLITKMKGFDYLSVALGQFNFSTQEFDYQHMVGLTDVIAWKEIVLPKESE